VVFLARAAASQNSLRLDFLDTPVPQPKQPGVQVLDSLNLAVLAEFIDWTPFFATWELKGRYPDILDHPQRGQEARKLFRDAKALLKRIIKDDLLQARAVFGLFPANRVGEDIALYEDNSRQQMRDRIHCLRQQHKRASGRANLSLADFVAPVESAQADWVGAFAVCAGFGCQELAQRYERDHDDYGSILVKSLADRLAEAAAEWLHQEVRRVYWGYAVDEQAGNEDLIKENYRGIRPAPGYPACPDHSEKETLFRLLDVRTNIGLELTESYAMLPAAAVSGWYFHHPQSSYFGVGKIAQDQLQDYAQRKGISVEHAARLLANNLV